MKQWHMAILALLALIALAALIWKQYSLPVEGTVGFHRKIEKSVQPFSSVTESSQISADKTSEKRLTVVSDIWPPFIGKSGTGNEGAMVEIIKSIYTPLGYKVDFLNAPWSRAIDMVRSGVADALVGADYDEVPDFIFPHETIGVTRPAFFVRSDSKWCYKSLESLNNVKLGVIQDYVYTYDGKLENYIRRKRDNGNIISLKGKDALQRLIKALMEMRIDVLIGNAPVVYETLNAIKISEKSLKIAGVPESGGIRLYLPFSPRKRSSSELADSYDRGIRLLRQNGKLKVVLKKYNLEDWRQYEKKVPGKRRSDLNL